MTILYTQYTYEKKWSQISHKEALALIQTEMPETDAQSTLDYILEALNSKKTITLGSSRFKY